MKSAKVWWCALLAAFAALGAQAEKTINVPGDYAAIADAVENVWRAGGRLDAWSDFFSFERWMKAFEDAGVDPAYYANRKRPFDEELPWDMVDVGVKKQHLIREAERAERAARTSSFAP